MEIISSYSLLPLISAVFVIVLGFFVWIKKPKELMHILVLLYTFTIALWLFGTFKLFNAVTDGDKIFWDRFIYIGVVFIPIFLYHFGLLYSNIKKQKWLLYVGYVLAMFFLPISQTSYFSDGLYKYSWGVHTIAKTYHHLFMVFFVLYFTLFFINLVIHYKKSKGIRKKQVGYVLLGYGVLDLIGPLAFLPAYGIPVYPIVFLSAIPFVLFLAYAIVRHNALEMRTITAEIVITLLNLVALSEIFFSKSYTEFIFRVLALFAILTFSLLLIRSIKKEIRRREQIAQLAHSLEKANLRLKELDQQKTEFLSIASHQLRTPLSILKGYMELIKDGTYGKPSKGLKGVINNMEESNERLVKLIDEFLNITRIEQGRTKFVFEMSDLCKVVRSAVDELQEKADENKMKLTLSCRGLKKTKVCMDSDRIRHVIFNFIDNAIKYSGKGVVKVKIEKERQYDGLTVRVHDNGLGFSKEDEVNFFQKFYRGKNVKGSDVSGTGLGLYVCRKFIEAHNGYIWGHSNGLGKGAEFGFFVPFKQK